MAPLEGAVLSKGSLILVTGANGLVGSHVVEQLLRHGYKVRASVRDAQKSGWLAAHFEERYGEGKLELLEVKDLTDTQALKEALSGCAGFVAIASDVSFGSDPKVVVTKAVKLVRASLEAAAATPSVKRFVLTSSAAAAMPRDGRAWKEETDIDTDSYDMAAVEKVWAASSTGSTDDPSMPFSVYSASKVQQEQEAWKFVSDHKPDFVLNTVLPDYVCGKIIDQEKQGFPTSMGVLKALWDGNEAAASVLAPQFTIDVEDNAMLHVAALLHPDAQGERVFGSAHKKNMTNTIQILRKLYPQREFMDPPENEAEDLSNILGRPRAEELLRWVKGSGWTAYEDALKSACDPWVKA